MKTRIGHIGSLSMVAGGLVLVSGCQITLTPGTVWVPPSQPVQETVMVPETYVEVDGVNVGIIGGQYYILSGGVWIVDREHYAYYHGWFRDHPGYWRAIGADHRVLPGHDGRNVPTTNGGQHPNVGTGQPKQQQPQTKGQPQKKPQDKKTTDKDQKPQ